MISKTNKRINISNLKFEEPKVKIGRKESSKGSVNDIFDKSIRPYIDIIDTMRKYGLEQDIELPNVVVVGDQSSGKSSIIELISGIQLPRGSGIVTRCPLELQLKKITNQPWKSIISYKTDTKKEVREVINHPQDVEMFIIKAQNEICGTKKGVSKELITLRVESPAENAPDLTLIDLPGISRTPVEDQPTDVCEQIKRIIMKHVKQENTVILCVIAGDLDIAVNESINIAQSMDPNGLRTIGVITKPDIADIDHKKEILKMLDKKKIDLKKGFNLVKCRSLEQLNNNLSLTDFLRNEMDFYENDDIYKYANKSQVGALHLANKITMELLNVIKISLPKLRTNIDVLLEQACERKDKLPQLIPLDECGKRSYIMNLTSDINETIRSFLYSGELLGRNNFHPVWRTHFDNFQKDLELKKEDAFKNSFSLANICSEINNNRGKEISGFLNFSLFERLMKPYIQSYKKNASDIPLKMGKILKDHLEKIFEKYFFYLPEIEKDLKKILFSQIEEKLRLTEERIDFIFKQEAILFTMDNEFDKIWKINEEKIEREKTRMFQVLNPIAKPCTNPEKMLRNIDCYLKIVHARLCDNVPSAVMQCLLIQLQEDLKNRIIQYVSSEEILNRINEDPTISDERKILSDRIERLKKGKTELECI